jgi:hypothetical protein
VKLGLFILNGVLPEGMSCPYDFGFIPATNSDDGDPLDVLLLMDKPAFCGCLAHDLRYRRELQIAIWFHDAVYDPMRKDNEERSAKAATICLDRFAESAQTIKLVRELVLATRRTATPASPDGSYMIASDLSIFGREAESKVAGTLRAPSAAVQRTAHGVCLLP